MMGSEDLLVFLNSQGTILEDAARHAFATPFICETYNVVRTSLFGYFAFVEGGGLQFVSCEA